MRASCHLTAAAGVAGDAPIFVHASLVVACEGLLVLAERQMQIG